MCCLNPAGNKSHKAKQEKHNGRSHRQTNIQFNVGKLETPGYTAETNQGKQDKGSKTEYRAQKYGDYQNKTGRNLTWDHLHSDGDLTRHRQHG